MAVLSPRTAPPPIGAAIAVKGYPTGHAYRSQAIVTRILAAALLLALSAVVALAIAVSQLVPSLRLVPLFLSIEPEQKTVVRVQPAVQDATIIDQLEHGWVRQYVIKSERVVPDASQMLPIVQPVDGWIARRSSVDVYAGFRSRNERYIRQAIAETVAREVRLDDPIRLPQPGRVYQVDFVSIEKTAEGQEIARHQLRAVLTVEYRATEASLAELRSGSLESPLGFVVVSYARTGRAESR